MEKLITILSEKPSILVGLILAVIVIVLAFVCLAITLIKSKAQLQIGSFKFNAADRESTKEPEKKKEKQKFEIRKQVEEYTRGILAKQFDQVVPFLSSLRPIFNKLVYSILNDAIVEGLGIERVVVVPKDDEDSSIPGSHYKVELVKTYIAEPQTRVFTNLVESTVDSLLCKLEREVYIMLINNNIGKTKDEVRAYIHLKSENLVGVIRNCLCDAYNDLSNKNLFDTTAYWLEAGITYPIDWIEDKLYHLFVMCLHCRYSDFTA